MKKWKGSDCGYMHKGEKQPVECPLCKKSNEQFNEISNEGGKSKSSEGSKDRKWISTVCGYVHEGAAPPAECPRCKSNTFREVKQTG